MELKRLGRSNEKIPAIGLGTWELTSPDAVAILKYGFDKGIRYVDTAEFYGTESQVGEAIKGRGDIFVATKVTPTHFRHGDVLKACDASLKKLKVKSIDLYQLHLPNPAIPIKETMGAMELLVKQGKIRHIGVSNFSVDEMKAAQEALKGSDIVSNQVEYSMLVRDIEHDILDYCSREKITVIAYSPLAHGRIYDKKYSGLLNLLSKVGEKYGKSPTQVAINWLIRKDSVVAIPKASTKEHVDELIGSSDFTLKKADADLIDRSLSKYHQRSMFNSFGPYFKAGLTLREWLRRKGP